MPAGLAHYNAAKPVGETADCHHDGEQPNLRRAPLKRRYDAREARLGQRISGRTSLRNTQTRGSGNSCFNL